MAGRLLLAGYLGCGNLGDDAVMLGFAHGAAMAGFSITVLSGHPEETNRYYGYSVVPRMEMKAVEAAIAQHDALVFPGGSVFQDVTSVRSVAYYQKLITMAKKANKKVFLVGQGVGPLKTFLGRRMAANAFSMADGIAVRDPASMDALKELGVKKSVRATADSAFLMPAPVETGSEDDFSVAGMKAVGIAPRMLDKKTDIVGIFGSFCQLLYQSGSMPVIVPMDRTEDGDLAMEISKRQGGKIPDLRRIATPMQLQQRLGRMDTVVAMRLHAGIIAAAAGVPPLMIAYDPKVTAFAKQLGISGAISMDSGLNPQRMMDAFLQFQKDRERNVRLLAKKVEDLRKQAEGNVELVVTGMGGRMPNSA